MVTEGSTLAPTKRPVHTDDGDHDLFSHYIKKEALERAVLDGVPAVALCGKHWLPTKDGLRYPVCPKCKDKWEQLLPGDE